MSAMAVNALREMLNRVRWHAGERNAAVTLSVRVRRRGVELVEQYDFAEVADVLAGGVTMHDGTFLPFHRIVEVLLNGCSVWSRGKAT